MLYYGRPIHFGHSTERACVRASYAHRYTSGHSRVVTNPHTHSLSLYLFLSPPAGRVVGELGGARLDEEEKFGE